MASEVSQKDAYELGPSMPAGSESAVCRADEVRERLYTSLPLPSTENELVIRVIDIHHAANLEARIEVSMRTISLQRPLRGGFSEPIFPRNYEYEYQTLSYAWNEQGTSEAMLCNDNVIFISPDLHCALKRIRERMKTPGEVRLEKRPFSSTLWVDALCINQRDDVEKADQVLNMDLIYQCAQRLIIWLGDASIEESVLLQRAMEGKADESDLRIAIPRLYNCAWFRRRWVVQEVLRSRAATRHVLIGDARFWFASVIHRITTFNPESSYFSDSFCKAPNAFETLNRSYFAGRFNTLPRVTRDLWPTLLENLMLFKDLECENSLDRLYSLRGVSSSKYDLEVDYSLSPLDAYTRLAKSLIYLNLSGQLILVCATMMKSPLDQGHPSWVPDWTARPSYSSPQHQFLCE